MHPEDPTRLGTYRVVRPLAQTPTGQALLGADATGRSVVLTVVRADVAAQAGFRERFAREVRAAAAAPPWFVAAVVDVDAAADPPWSAALHVPGTTLQEFVDERGPLGDAGTAALAERLAGGLVALHAAGLVHGDLTPSAVVLAEDGPRLVGFGLARAAGPDYGTPGFQAPEQAARAGQASPSVQAADTTGPPTVPATDTAEGPAVDLFALGCVVGFAATGRSPFAAGSPAETRHRVAEGDPDLGPMGEPVRSVVLSCLHKDPARRPTAAQAAAMLGPTAGQATVVSPAEPAGYRLSPAGPHPTGVGPPPGPSSMSAGPPPGAAEPPPTLIGLPPVGAGAPWTPPVGPGPPRRRRGPVITALVAAAAVVAAGIVGAVLLTARVGGTPSAVGPAPASAAPSAAGGATGPVDPGTGATLVDTAPFGADGPRFTTPSGNISCQMSDTSATSDGDARCDVAQRSWQAPPKPADCAGDYGAGATVSGAEKAQLTCATDTVADPDLEVLQYGQAVSYGGVVCDSQETGVRCVNRATGHGFRVARASYDLF